MVTSPHYRLADGIILNIGKRQAGLVKLGGGGFHKISMQELRAVEAITLGTFSDSQIDIIERLVDEGLIEPGEWKMDPLLLDTLAELDQRYLRYYEQELSQRELLALKNVRTAHATRKRFLESVGQCPVLPETALRRAMLVGDANIVGVKKVLCIGDDDLVSIALATLGHEVTVFDIDDYLIRFLGQVATLLELSITVREHDLRDPVAEEQCGEFDIFLTDPMSNRECFELFISRAFSMLKPDGVGYTAVFTPVERLFRDIAGEMNFAIASWNSRFNRYYNSSFFLHNYESDWVEIRPTKELALPLAKDDYAAPLRLYKEDHYEHLQSSICSISNVEDTQLATPFFFDTLMDVVEKEQNARYTTRFSFTGDGWTMLFCPHPIGYLSIWFSLTHKHLVLDCYPYNAEVERELRRALIAIYASNAEDASVTITRTVWDVRVFNLCEKDRVLIDMTTGR